MKRSFVFSVALLSLVSVGATGCAHTYLASKRSAGPLVQRPRSFALAVTVAGGLQPTPAQWTAIQAKFAAELAARGWVLVTDLDLADHIVRVHFTPSVDDPENTGRAVVIAVRANSRSNIARSGFGPYPSSVGYTSFNSGSWMSGSRFSSGYYGYSDFYNDGYSYHVPVTPVTPPVAPPYRRPPHHRDDCPPSIIGGLPSRGGIATSPINDHPRTPPRDFGRFPSDRATFANVSGAGFDSRAEWNSRAASRSERTSWRSDSSYSRAETGYNRSSAYSRPEPIYSHSEPSYSNSSRSEPSYSPPPPSPSYSAPDTSYSAPAAASVSYSAPSYSSPSETTSTESP